MKICTPVESRISGVRNAFSITSPQLTWKTDWTTSRCIDIPTYNSFSRMTVPFVSNTFYAPGVYDLISEYISAACALLLPPEFVQSLRSAS